MNNYRQIRVIGRGSYGVALLATPTGGDLVGKYKAVVIKSIKIGRMSAREREASLNEVRLLKALRHPNIVTLLDSFEEKGSLHIVMEFCSGGDLSSVISSARSPLPENRILDMFVQICLSLKHCHDRKILHRDLKPQNVFVTGKRRHILKLGDFGIARVLENTMDCAKTAIGTPYFLSPEICREKSYDHGTDIWSLGCILYEMATLRHAFDAPNLHSLVLRILAGKYRPISTSYSEGMRKIVTDCLQVNPKKRPGINAILARPVIRARIQHFLSETICKAEFSHTVLHGHHPLTRAKLHAADKREPSADPVIDEAKRARQRRLLEHQKKLARQAEHIGVGRSRQPRPRPIEKVRQAIPRSVAAPKPLPVPKAKAKPRARPAAPANPAKDFNKKWQDRVKELMQCVQSSSGPSKPVAVRKRSGSEDNCGVVAGRPVQPIRRHSPSPEKPAIKQQPILRRVRSEEQYQRPPVSGVQRESVGARRLKERKEMKARVERQAREEKSALAARKAEFLRLQEDKKAKDRRLREERKRERAAIRKKYQQRRMFNAESEGNTPEKPRPGKVKQPSLEVDLDATVRSSAVSVSSTSVTSADRDIQPRPKKVKPVHASGLRQHIRNLRKGRKKKRSADVEVEVFVPERKPRRVAGSGAVEEQKMPLEEETPEQVDETVEKENSPHSTPLSPSEEEEEEESSSSSELTEEEEEDDDEEEEEASEGILPSPIRTNKFGETEQELPQEVEFVPIVGSPPWTPPRPPPSDRQLPIDGEGDIAHMALRTVLEEEDEDDDEKEDTLALMDALCDVMESPQDLDASLDYSSSEGEEVLSGEI